MTSTLSTRREDTHLGGHADNQPKHGGPGGRREKGSCTTCSRIMSWCANGTGRRFRNVGFRWPRYHDSDHRAVVATIKLGRRRLKEYRRKHQEFPLQLPPVEQQDDLTRAFEALKVTCEEPETTKAHWREWMSDSTWLLIKQRTSLRRAGQL